MFGIKQKISDFEALGICMKEIAKLTASDCPRITLLMQRYHLFDFDQKIYNADALVDRIWSAWLFAINTINIYQSYGRDEAEYLYSRAYMYLEKVLNKGNQIDYMCDLTRKFENRYLMFEKIYETTHDDKAFPPVASLMIVVSSLSSGAYSELPTNAIKKCPDFSEALESINRISAGSQNVWKDIQSKYSIKKIVV